MNRFESLRVAVLPSVYLLILLEVLHVLLAGFGDLRAKFRELPSDHQCLEHGSRRRSLAQDLHQQPESGSLLCEFP